MAQLSVASEVNLDRTESKTGAMFVQKVVRARAGNTGCPVPDRIVVPRRVGCPYTDAASHEPHQPLRYQEYYMKKTLATLLVAGALAAAGLSASAAVSASSDNSGQGSIEAVNWWPNSTPKK
jgi:hypothetical protein